MKFSTNLLFATLLASARASGVVELTLDNFEDKIAGKNAIVNFFAPWSGQSKSLKLAWDQLGDECSSSSVLIGDADCTDAGEELCEKYSVSGYPTLKYFVDGDTKGQDYQGGRDFNSLKKFVDEKLEVPCLVDDPKDCTDKEKDFITKMIEKTVEERAAQLKRLEGMKASSMKPELKFWLMKRLRILKSLNAGSEDEL